MPSAKPKPTTDREIAADREMAVNDAAALLDTLFPTLSEGGQRAVVAWLDEYVHLVTEKP